MESGSLPRKEEERLGLLSGIVVGAAAGLVGAWVAAGSTGLLGHPLRRGLTCVALGVVVVAAWPRPAACRRMKLALGLAIGAAVAMIACSLPAVNLLAASVILLAIAEGRSAQARTTLRLAAEAVVVLGLYRVAVTTLPQVWLAADRCAAGLGFFAARPLWVGATFAGLDFLVPMLYLAIAAPLRLMVPGRSWRPILVALVAVAVGHLVYLTVVSLAPAMLEHLPEPKPQQTPLGPQAPPISLELILWKSIPWNMPALAAAIHALIAWGLLGALAHLRGAGAAQAQWPRAGRLTWGLTGAAVLLAAVFPCLTVLASHAPSLNGKKIVIYKEGFLNWLKPVHGEYGRLSIGMYGMLPAYLESFGAKALISPDLSERDLFGADALVLLYPNEPWKPGQLERIWNFVRGGGSLLVMGEHTVWEKQGGGSRFNDVLEPTAIRVAFDSAMFAVGGWLHSYDTVAHPISTGLTDQQNEFGSVIGASLLVRRPARPLLIGRWGWADPGDRTAGGSLMGNHRYDAGEKLGDLILAAEQPLGKGRVIAFGDTSALTNGLTPGCHRFTSRLLAYLADRSVPTPPAWRHGLGLAVLLAVLALVLARPTPGGLAAVAVALSASLAACTRTTYHTWTVLPDGRLKSPNNLAYIDTSRPAWFSQESWRPEGLGGLTMTLMRQGFVTLNLPEIDAQRLARARVLVCVAPAREYPAAERRVLKDFVAGGGILILSVGYPESGPSRSLLDDFGFSIGLPPEKDPEGEPYPLGHFKAPFFNGGDYVCYVRFHAAWPVFCVARESMPIALYPGDLSIITVRRYRKGLVAVIGDTYFATNKNLEHEGGEPFEGMRENAVFWRWFLSFLRDGMGEGKIWYPPPPQREDLPTSPRTP